jgi:hypothetical protein
MRRSFDLDAHFKAQSIREGLPADFLRHEANVEFLKAWLGQLPKGQPHGQDGGGPQPEAGFLAIASLSGLALPDGGATPLSRLRLRDRDEWLWRYHRMDVEGGPEFRVARQGGRYLLAAGANDHVALAILASKGATMVAVRIEVEDGPLPPAPPALSRASPAPGESVTLPERRWAS